MEFPRYISTPSQSFAIGATETISSQTITLPNIPDLLVIYVKPSAYSDCTQGDWSLPVQNISVNFDNFSGLLANHTQEEIYQMSLRNGVDMDFSEWVGSGVVPSSHSGAASSVATARGGRVGLVGGPLVLKPGRDFALQTGQAPGLVGNFTLQFNLRVTNNTGLVLNGASTPAIYTIPLSSGFFETIKGSSRIIKGVLTEQDILGAPSHAPEASLERPVGAASPGGAPMKHSGMPKHSAMGAYM
jgi:hypothetical protein